MVELAIESLPPALVNNGRSRNVRGAGHALVVSSSNMS